MATILKSNSIANKFMFSALEAALPSDYRASMSFATEKYTLDGTVKAIKDMIISSRTTTAGYVDNSGDYAVAATTTARIHNSNSIGKGLLIEGAFTNVLANPSTPTTQTITQTLGATSFFVVQVWGTGACAVEIKTSAGALVETGIATEAQPYLFIDKTTGIINAQVKVTPTNITHFQAYSNATATKKQTKAPAAGLVASDSITITPSVFSTVMATRNEMTIVIKRAEAKKLVANTYNLVRNAVVTNITDNSTAKGIFVGKNISGNSFGSLRVNQATDVTIQNIESSGSEVFAVAFNKTAVSLLQNGSVVSLPITETSPVSRAYLGGGAAGTTASDHIIKEVYVYDRKLTDAELLAITV